MFPKVSTFSPTPHRLLFTVINNKTVKKKKRPPKVLTDYIFHFVLANENTNKYSRKVIFINLFLIPLQVINIVNIYLKKKKMIIQKAEEQILHLNRILHWILNTILRNILCIDMVKKNPHRKS